MTRLTAFEAKTRFGELLERVAAGEEVVITRHDKAVARVIPEGRPRMSDVHRAVDELLALQQQIGARLKRKRGRTRLTDEDVRAAIDEGRL